MHLHQTAVIICAIGLFYSSTSCQAQAPAEPAYQLVLRSRQAEAVPNRTRNAQTGGGTINVTQLEANTFAITMTGSAVVGSDLQNAFAGIDFTLDQEFDIIPTRQGVRRPRIGMVGQVVGTLQVTNPGKSCFTTCGSAEQSLATACVMSGETSLLTINMKPSVVSTSQELSINHREGPVESLAASGSYRLTSQFRFSANQGKGIWHRQAAVADFDPAPQLDGFWANALKPFRAVPRRDFGFKLIVRVVEDATPATNSTK